MANNNNYTIINSNEQFLVNPKKIMNNELEQLTKNYKKMEKQKRFNSQSLLLKPTVPNGKQRIPGISTFAQNYNDNNNTNNKPLLPPGWRWSPNSPPSRSRTVSNVGDPLPLSSDQRSRTSSNASTASFNARSRTSSNASTGSTASKRKLSYPPNPQESRAANAKNITALSASEDEVSQLHDHLPHLVLALDAPRVVLPAPREFSRWISHLLRDIV